MSTPLPSEVLIVVPAWQEEEAIVGTLTEIRRALPGFAILVVDDGSRDRTSEIAAANGATVATLPFNVGVGGAMRAGFLYARRMGFKAMVQVDADGQHDPALVPSLLAALGEHDIVIGARFAGVGEYRARGPRRLAMVVLAGVLSRLLRTKLTDVTSGFRASGTRAIELFERDYPAEYLGDTVESLVVAHRAGLRVTQVPVHMRPRQGGTPSHAPWKAAIYLARAMLVLLLALVRTKDRSRP